MSNKRDEGRGLGASKNAKNIKKQHLMKKKRRKKKRIRKIRRVIISIFMVAIFIFVGVMGYIYSILGGLNNDNSLPSSIPTKSKESLNVLVVGMDIGDAENQKNKAIRRTDSIMLVNYNPNTKKMHIVSIPRDTMIEVDAYLDNGEYRRYWKINNAYVLGGEEELIKQVEKLLNIKINNMVEVDYAAFRNLIDAVGPIEMNIQQDMFYDDDAQNLHINFKGGETVQLDGKKAEEFFRWRKNNDGTGLVMGDVDRIKNQHEFIGKVMDRCLTPSILFKVPKISKAITDNVVTNLKASTMVSLGFKMLRLNKEDIIMTTLQGTFEDIYGQSYFMAKKSSNVDLIKALNETSSSKDQVKVSINKKDVKIMVLNATGTAGLAGNLKNKLASLGYENVDIGNTTSQNKSIIQTDSNDVEEVLKADTEITKVGSSKGSEYEKYDAVVIIGDDYKVYGS